MSRNHLAQINIGTLKAPMDAPETAGFADNLDRINALAEDQPGFVWRLTGEGDAGARGGGQRPVAERTRLGHRECEVSDAGEDREQVQERAGDRESDPAGQQQHSERRPRRACEGPFRASVERGHECEEQSGGEEDLGERQQAGRQAEWAGGGAQRGE